MNIIDLGMIDYKDAYHLQKDYVQKVIDGAEPVLLFCEHPVTITMGRMAKKEHILGDIKQMEDRGIYIEYIDRGGDITLHGPGQLVVYPIMDLGPFGKDLRAYLRRLEAAVIALFGELNIQGRRVSGQTGVWVDDRKVVSLGIGVKRWVAYHGIGINVNTDLALFSMIKPCGLNVEMNSISNIIGHTIDMDMIKQNFARFFLNEFELSQGEKNG